ncbi:peptide-methionine (S)-S-oxide reductase MsrA [Paenibacillus qinlingensis]|uniref:Peptide methionine sulfoxide reductase MsrA n=1 Tax=Paenibacillus qinlingensis TaxID=1837343 RepID=A0ABU1P069_9BACL|nr:peptide-methionine (S)-S-oxide reductase MsrA [Paenibacillus qinlingensis]MDR6553153.1 peptide-methionine (S)-S-oxide reductase [Paenibacillus qinlingensis]
MNSSNDHTITLGMGCFWSPDALFGQLPGVVRTRVGFAGGTTDHPTYREMGDHTETVEIVFNSDLLSLENLLNVFWSNHNPTNINDYKGRQYTSMVLYRDSNQQSAAQHVLTNREQQGNSKIDTEIAPYTTFYLAEDRHQKYYLKRYPDAIDKLRTLFSTDEELTNATLAARLNGLAKGYTNMDSIVSDIRTWPISTQQQEKMIRLIRLIKW